MEQNDKMSFLAGVLAGLSGVLIYTDFLRMLNEHIAGKPLSLHDKRVVNSAPTDSPHSTGHCNSSPGTGCGHCS